MKQSLSKTKRLACLGFSFFCCVDIAGASVIENSSYCKLLVNQATIKKSSSQEDPYTYTLADGLLKNIFLPRTRTKRQKKDNELIREARFVVEQERETIRSYANPKDVSSSVLSRSWFKGWRQHQIKSSEDQIEVIFNDQAFNSLDESYFKIPQSLTAKKNGSMVELYFKYQGNFSPDRVQVPASEFGSAFDAQSLSIVGFREHQKLSKEYLERRERSLGTLQYQLSHMESVASLDDSGLRPDTQGRLKNSYNSVKKYWEIR